jgi:6-pyruvoyltetrahydropterin/6-carboxytetrahydropterin synthase
MSITLMKRIRFCAGHRLLRHEGKCANLHGHNYTAEFFVTGDSVDAIGRVIDFSDLKRRLKGWLDEHWDHAFILFDEDEQAIRAIKSVDPHRIYVLPVNPTAENMARYLLDDVCPGLLEGTGARATKVVVWESEDSYAEATVATNPGAESAPSVYSERNA